MARFKYNKALNEALNNAKLEYEPFFSPEFLTEFPAKRRLSVLIHELLYISEKISITNNSYLYFSNIRERNKIENILSPESIYVLFCNTKDENKYFLGDYSTVTNYFDTSNNIEYFVNIIQADKIYILIKQNPSLMKAEAVIKGQNIKNIKNLENIDSVFSLVISIDASCDFVIYGKDKKTIDGFCDIFNNEYTLQ